MSILIKGMEMPKSCAGCPIDSDSCELWTQLPVTSLSNTRHEDCPLVSVPTPHGRCIDADATRGSIKPWSPEDERNACTFDTVKKLMHTMLDNAPTIIEAEEGET